VTLRRTVRMTPATDQRPWSSPQGPYALSVELEKGSVSVSGCCRPLLGANFRDFGPYPRAGRFDRITACAGNHPPEKIA
jgi:hypothetical protein